jgi:hypothetical protein
MERFLDAILPGAGLVISGRLAGGIPLFAMALVLAAGAVVAVLMGGAVTPRMLPPIAAGYVLLIAIAQSARWAYARRARFDPQAARRLARSALAAWLRDQPEAAATASRQLLKLAPEEPGAWRLRHLVLGDGRDLAQAERLERERG